LLLENLLDAGYRILFQLISKIDRLHRISLLYGMCALWRLQSAGWLQIAWIVLLANTPSFPRLAAQVC